MDTNGVCLKRGERGTIDSVALEKCEWLAPWFVCGRISCFLFLCFFFVLFVYTYCFAVNLSSG